MAEIRPPVSFDDMELFRLRMALRVEPPPVIRARPVNTQRVPVPSPDRVAAPGRIRVRWMLPPIQKHLLKPGLFVFIHEDKNRWSLHHLHSGIWPKQIVALAQ